MIPSTLVLSVIASPTVEHRRRVDQHDVGALAQVREDLAQHRPADELARIRRDRAGGQHLEHALDRLRGAVPVAVSVPVRMSVAAGVQVQLAAAARRARIRIGHGDPRQRGLQRRVPERDLRDPRSGQAEELVQERTAQVEVDEDDALAGARERDCEVGDRRRLALLLDGARDHDRAHVAVERDEVEIRAEHAERLRLYAGRIVEHDQMVLGAQLLARCGDPGEQRQAAELLADLLCAAYARIECLPQEGETDPEHETEHEAEDPVAARLRLDLRHLVGLLDDVRLGRGERGHLRELLLPREEVRVEGRPPLAGPSELRHAAVDVVEGALHRRRVELAPVDRVGARVRVSELARDNRIVVRDVEVEQVGVRLRRDARVVEELLRGERGDAGELQRGRGYRGHARDERLRLHDRRVLLVHGRVLGARQRVGQVLPVEQHLRRALVELLLVQRERDRRSRHQHDRRQDDPFPPLDHVQVVAKRGRMAYMPSSHARTPPRLPGDPYTRVCLPYCDVWPEPSMGRWSYVDQ